MPKPIANAIGERIKKAEPREAEELVNSVVAATGAQNTSFTIWANSMKQAMESRRIYTDLVLNIVSGVARTTGYKVNYPGSTVDVSLSSNKTIGIIIVAYDDKLKALTRAMGALSAVDYAKFDKVLVISRTKVDPAIISTALIEDKKKLIFLESVQGEGVETALKDIIKQ